MNFKAQEAYTFDDLMLVPRHSTIRSRKEPDTSTFIGKSELQIPIIAAPMNTVTEWHMAQAMADVGADSVLHRYMTIEEQYYNFKNVKAGNKKPWVAVGATGDFLERAVELYKKGARKFCVDVANGHSEVCTDAVLALRKRYSDIDIMAGNICSGEGVVHLCDAGANVLRVGIGPGSMCTTRLVTGFGVPQITAIDWCLPMAEKYEAHIVADGGIRSSGDIVKALARGADAVMVGGLLAGTDQTPGDTTKDLDTGQLYKYYHGMASAEGRREWFDKESTAYVPEGASTKVPHKGDAKKVVEELNNSLKVGMSFANATTLAELRVNARWVRVTDNGRKEGTPNRKLFKR